jgi:hypothetical protein
LDEARHTEVIGFFNGQLHPRELMNTDNQQPLLASFLAKVESEIQHDILPRLNGEPGFKDELFRLYARSRLDLKVNTDLVERCARHMPKAEGEAFRYVVYRDLNRLLEMYLEFADQQIPEPSGTRALAAAA